MKLLNPPFNPAVRKVAHILSLMQQLRVELCGVGPKTLREHAPLIALLDAGKDAMAPGLTKLTAKDSKPIYCKDAFGRRCVCTNPESAIPLHMVQVQVVSGPDKGHEEWVHQSELSYE